MRTASYLPQIPINYVNSFPEFGLIKHLIISHTDEILLTGRQESAIKLKLSISIIIPEMRLIRFLKKKIYDHGYIDILHTLLEIATPWGV